MKNFIVILVLISLPYNNVLQSSVYKCFNIISKNQTYADTGKIQIKTHILVGKDTIYIVETKEITTHRYTTSKLISVETFKGQQKLQTIVAISNKRKDYIGDEICLYEDVNFDGYLDILIKNSDHYTFSCWLYRPVTKRFVEIPAFAKIHKPYIDKSKKEIVSIEEELFANCQYANTTKYYQFRGENLELVNVEYFRSNSDPNKTEEIIKIPEQFDEK